MYSLKRVEVKANSDNMSLNGFFDGFLTPLIPLLKSRHPSTRRKLTHCHPSLNVRKWCDIWCWALGSSSPYTAHRELMNWLKIVKLLRKVFLAICKHEPQSEKSLTINRINETSLYIKLHACFSVKWGSRTNGRGAPRSSKYVKRK